MTQSDNNKRTTKRHWGWRLAILIGVLAALGAFWHIRHRDKPADASAAGGDAMRQGGGQGGASPGKRGAGGGHNPPATVGIATATSGSIPLYIEALGTVVPAASVTVRPQVSGTLKQVLYQEGQQVRAGQVLALIDPRPFEIALMQASGQRQRDEAQLALARLNLQRNQALLQQDAIARQDVESQAAQVKQLEGTVMSDRASENIARLNLDYTRITAPVSGKVGLRPVDAGNIVSQSDTGGVAVITQTTPIDVLFAVPQDRVPDIQRRIDQKARLPVTALDRTRAAPLDEGAFSTIDNQVDKQTGTVKAKARFGNTQGRLFPNQFVNVRLLLDTLNNVVTVPVAAVRTGPDGDYVYVLREDRTVALRKVTRGPGTATLTAISDGLKAGEKVVTEGADRLKDGARVVLPDGQGRGMRGQGGGAGHAASGASGAASGASGPWHHRRDREGAAGDQNGGSGERATRERP